MSIILTGTDEVVLTLDSDVELVVNVEYTDVRGSVRTDHAHDFAIKPAGASTIVPSPPQGATRTVTALTVSNQQRAGQNAATITVAGATVFSGTLQSGDSIVYAAGGTFTHATSGGDGHSGGAGAGASVTDGVTTVAEARTIQLPKGAVSLDGDGVAVLSVMVTRVVPLTDAQIKALPTTPIELVASPGPGMLLAPILCVAAQDFAAAYTNVGAHPSNYLQFTYGTAPTAGQISIGALQEDEFGFFGAGGLAQFPIPLGAVEDGNGGSFPPGNRDLRDLGVYVRSTNVDAESADLGDYTGGDPANTLKVLVAYAVFDLT